MPDSHPVIHTERLILRPPVLADLDRWTEFMADEESTRHIGGVQPRARVWRALMTVAGAWSLTGVSMFSVVERESGRWIGHLGPWQPDGWPGTEVGWSLHRDAWGKGYALEGARAAMNYAFDVLGWTEVIHCIAPDNQPSQAVARKLGSQRLGSVTMPAPFETFVCDKWGQTREKWRSAGS
jgi:RimJ/RimL family protein N-acetyltransferase